uniref:Uncharacterized protein n=1 Tax=Cajanus cajan TaxID=3821 RepID=A0A151RGD2_CAJCA|nr:hypothetical protein KK1_037010 [Cajanus cajan]
MILSQKLVDHGCRVIFVNSDFNHKRMMSSMVEQQHSLDESLLKLVSIPDGLGPDDDERNEPGKLLDAVFSTMPRTLEKLIEDIHMKGDHKIGFIVADLAMVWAFEVASKMAFLA